MKKTSIAVALLGTALIWGTAAAESTNMFGGGSAMWYANLQGQAAMFDSYNNSGYGGGGYSGGYSQPDYYYDDGGYDNGYVDYSYGGGDYYSADMGDFCDECWGDE